MTKLSMHERDALRMFDHWKDGVPPRHKAASFRSLEGMGLVERRNGSPGMPGATTKTWHLTDVGRERVAQMKRDACIVPTMNGVRLDGTRSGMDTF